MHSLLEESESSEGYLLLRVLRSYLILDTYAAMEVHTTETIEAGRKELAQFESLMNVSWFLKYFTKIMPIYNIILAICSSNSGFI
jgi:hypothetical protein